MDELERLRLELRELRRLFLEHKHVIYEKTTGNYFIDPPKNYGFDDADVSLFKGRVG